MALQAVELPALLPHPPRPPRRRWSRRLLRAVEVLVVLAACLVVATHLYDSRRPVALPALVPFVAGAALPADRIVFDSNRSGSYQLYTERTDGTAVRQLTRVAGSDVWWPRLSPDRTKILYYRSPAGDHDHSYTVTSLWETDITGSRSIELLPSGAYGWQVQGHAEWSADGSRLVMFAGARLNPQIVVTDAHGRHPHAVTRRGGLNIDPSWAPDDRAVVFTGCPHAICTPGRFEIYRLDLGSGTVTRLTEDTLRDNDPAYSPDGTRVAWLTESSASPRPAGTWNIRVADADGSNVRWLTHTGDISSRPNWSADGTHIWFHRWSRAGGAPGFQIWRVDTDGADARQLTDATGNSEYPSP